MLTLGPVGFTAPWLLLGLLVLPLLWVLLRAVPPAPLRRRFPAVALLLGLSDEDQVTDRTPWWLLLLRALAVAALILGFAGPVLNPVASDADGDGPLLIVVDGTWAQAPGWDGLRGDLRRRLMSQARPVAVVLASAPETPVFAAPDQTVSHLPGLEPRPWGLAAPDWVPEERFDTLWISDGLGWPERGALHAALTERGNLRVVEPAAPRPVLTGVAMQDGLLSVTGWRAGQGDDPTVQAIGPDPSGVERVLAEAPMRFDGGEGEARLTLPAELRNRVTSLKIEGARSAGRVWLTGGALTRREIGLVAGRAEREAMELLAPLHYLRQALTPTAELIEGTLLDLLQANPDVLVLADVAGLAGAEVDALTTWLEQGGLLLRFAGPSMARAEPGEDPLLPVRLRAGGRTIGGAMSWGTPKALAPFDVTSPFHGLSVPGDVEVSAQVLAEPGPDLEGRVIARLADGTPLVTRKPVGAGQIVLFHVTANAEWSTLPLSGLFVQMLERLAIAAGSPTGDAKAEDGTIWQITQSLRADGALTGAEPASGVDGAALQGAAGPDLPPGLYESDDRVFVLNAPRVTGLADWPAGTVIEQGSAAPARALGGPLLALALILLAVDVAATLALGGRLLALMLVLLLPPDVQAQEADDFAIQATRDVVLAHVLTGDAKVDEIAQAGLQGLSDTLFRRSSIEPGIPMGVDVETDELAFFPLLYWPITETQPLPSAQAVARLNRYLLGGGMIVFDTRDADLAGYGDTTANGRKLRALAAALDIPPLEPMPQDHVLTRAFYLLDSFPGRYAGEVWVEAAPAGAQAAEGMPFRDLNDGVSPVVIGGADWAAAWATDDLGNPLLPVGRGTAGERQRELAHRFGLNLVMHVLTGNYKSDQVHVPALLDRLEAQP
ncbi:MAG: LytTR family transcriptional regulator [Rhodobacterales bacterium]|nr:MAG: LytTR family transcriptional regulator [Rhodobacterales bacterium]